MRPIAVAAILGIFALAGCAASEKTGTLRPSGAAAAAPNTTTTVPANEDGCVSAEEYAALRDGMSFSDALTVLGDNGQEMADSNLAGYHTTMYTWEGCGSLGANMNAMFQNGSLVQKAQFGLAATGKAPVLPTTTTTSPAQAAAAEAARREMEADALMGGCRHTLEGVGPYTSYTSRRECREDWKGTFKPGMTYTQVDNENMARIEKESAKQLEEMKVEYELGGCRHTLAGSPYTSYASRQECQDTWKGTFVAGMTYQQVDDENMARIKEQYPAHQ